MGPLCNDNDLRSGIPDLAPDRRVDHLRVDEVSAYSLHGRSCFWGIAPQRARLPSKTELLREGSPLNDSFNSPRAADQGRHAWPQP